MRRRFHWMASFGSAIFMFGFLPWAINQLPDKTWVIEHLPYREILSQNQNVLTILFVILLLGVAWLLPAQFSSWKSETKPDPHLRKLFLEQMQTGVKRELTDRLIQGIPIPLILEEQPYLVSRSPLTRIPIDPSKSIKDFFDREDIGGKLLISGESGGGKTITLLMLADSLLTQARQPEETFIPVIFQLSKWRNGQSIADWLVDQLRDRCKQINRPTLQDWLSSGHLLPLLDGLDELGRERQALCINAINEFVEANSFIKLVVCCRTQAIQEADIRLESLNNAVCVKRLTNEQIEEYLKRVDRAELWQRICSSAMDGSKLIQIPLFLTMMAAVDSERPILTQSDLLDAYIFKQLERDSTQWQHGQSKDKEWVYRPENTKRYLRWLAKKLTNAGLTEFWIEYIESSWLNNTDWWYAYKDIFGQHPPQISWLDEDSHKKQYWLIVTVPFLLLTGLISLFFPTFILDLSLSTLSSAVALILGLLLGSLTGLFFDWLGSKLLNASIYRAMYQLMGQLKAKFMSLFFKLISEFLDPDISDIFIIQWKYFISILKFSLIMSIFLTPLFLTFQFLHNLFHNDLSKVIALMFSISPPVVAIGIISGLCLGCFTGLVIGGKIYEKESVGSGGAAEESFQGASFASVITSVVIFLMLTQLTYFIGIILVTGVGIKLTNAVMIPLIPLCLLMVLDSPLIDSLKPGLMGYIEHLPLRLVLCFNAKVMTWDYTRFLDYCVKRKLLLSVGGRYRFIHSELLAHFAQMHI